MKTVSVALITLFGALLAYASLGLPDRGEGSPYLEQETTVAGTPLASAYFINYAYRDTQTPNMVSVVLADYRSWDTLGEEAVVFTAGMVCYLLLRSRRREGDSV